MIVYKIIMAVIFIEALTELVVKSEFFHPVRKWFFKIDNKVCKFIHEILDCGYCFSVWASIFTIGMFSMLDNIYVIYFIYIIVLHRLSNLFHFLVDRLDKNKN